MSRTSPSEPLPTSLETYREQFLQTAATRNSMYLQAKVREQQGVPLMHRSITRHEPYRLAVRRL